jgi:Na+/melibiose symporter-like transporter
VGGIQGFFIGAYDTAQISWIIEIWKGASDPLIQAQYFCYALGANIPPLLLAPFLSGDEERNKTITSLSINEEAKENEHQLTTPFSIGGGFTTIACVFQAFLFIFFRYYVPPEEKLESVQDSTSSETEPLINQDDDEKYYSHIVTINPEEHSSHHHHLIKAPGINWKKLQLVILSATFLAAYSSMELNSIQFLPTFARYSALNLSESESAFVLSGLTGSFAVGRGLGIFIIMKFPPQLMLAVSLVFVLVGNGLLLGWGDQNLNLLLVSSIIMGFSYSTVYPSFCAFMEKHLVFSNEQP